MAEQIDASSSPQMRVGMPASGVLFDVIDRRRSVHTGTMRCCLKHLGNGEHFWIDESALVHMLKRQRVSLFVRVRSNRYRQVSGPRMES